MEIVTGLVDISLQLGFAYALIALGVVISFRILRFPDLTVDGTFALGAAGVATFITLKYPPLVSLAFAVLLGAIAGAITGILNTKLKINKLLAGMLMMIILYSVNLRIMGRSNIPLLDIRTVLSPFETYTGMFRFPLILFFGVIAIGLKLLLDVFLYTEFGTALRATGNNPKMVRTLGLNTNLLTIVGLALANGIVALGGALTAQYQGFADVNMGLGMIIIGLASIIIGEAFVRPTTVLRVTLAPLTGSLVYQFIVALGLRLGIAPTDLKLATGIMVILFLSFKFAQKGEFLTDETF